MRICGFFRAGLAVCIATAIPAITQANGISYPDFSSTAGLTLAGNTKVTTTGDGKVLRLTPAEPSQSGAAYSTGPVTLGANGTFSTRFQFRFTNPGGYDPSDGITFVLAAGPSGLGTGGGGLGYQGVGNSDAIEFDTFNNSEGSGNHVAVDRNGSLSDLALANPYGVTACDFGPSTPYGASGCMTNGDIWTALIKYDGSRLNVTVTDGSKPADHLIKDYTINFGSDLGGNVAYVGFTGGTGSGWENQDILNWQFSSTATLTEDPTATPEPASLGLAGSVLWVLVMVGYRRSKVPSIGR